MLVFFFFSLADSCQMQHIVECGFLPLLHFYLPTLILVFIMHFLVVFHSPLSPYDDWRGEIHTTLIGCFPQTFQFYCIFQIGKIGIFVRAQNVGKKCELKISYFYDLVANIHARLIAIELCDTKCNCVLSRMNGHLMLICSVTIFFVKKNVGKFGSKW